jgi:hypothetical protein
VRQEHFMYAALERLDEYDAETLSLGADGEFLALE